MRRQFWMFSLKGQLSWGKYNGKNHKWVIDNDPQYLVWLIDNLKNFTFRFRQDFEDYWIAKMGFSLHKRRLDSGLRCRDHVEPSRAQSWLKSKTMYQPENEKDLWK